jgi:hypothetical protein
MDGFLKRSAHERGVPGRLRSSIGAPALLQIIIIAIVIIVAKSQTSPGMTRRKRRTCFSGRFPKCAVALVMKRLSEGTALRRRIDPLRDRHAR